MDTGLLHFPDATLQGRIKKGLRVSIRIQKPVSGIDTSIHLHPNMLHIACCKSGTGFVHCGQDVHRLRPGFIYMFYPGIPHRFRSTRKHPYCAWFVHVEVAGAVIRELPNIIPLQGSRFRIESLMRRMHRISNRACPGTRDLRLVGMLAELYADLIELAESASSRGGPTTHPNPGASDTHIPGATLKHMLERFQSPPFDFPGIDALASEAAMSRRSFTSFFRKMTGCAPYELFNTLRIQHARELLSTGELNVGEVGACCGYASAQSFIRAYKSQFDSPPRRHRMRTGQA